MDLRTFCLGLSMSSEMGVRALFVGANKKGSWGQGKTNCRLFCSNEQKGSKEVSDLSFVRPMQSGVIGTSPGVHIPSRNPSDTKRA